MTTFAACHFCLQTTVGYRRISIYQIPSEVGQTRSIGKTYLFASSRCHQKDSTVAVNIGGYILIVQILIIVVGQGVIILC